MSQFTFLASNSPLDNMENPHVKHLSINEAVALGLEIPKLLSHNIDKDKPGVMLWVDDKNNLGDINIFDVQWHKTYTEGLQYNSIVEWVYTDERAERLISYIRKHLESTDLLELWHIWLDSDNDIIGTPEIVWVSVDGLTTDALSRHLKDNKGDDRPVRIIIERNKNNGAEGFGMGKKLVAYFSASGVTRKVAELLAEAAGADLYEIKPQVPYTKADLNWQDNKSRSSVEMADKSSRPAMADKDANIGIYDTVFVGFPIWWYVAPIIVNTFLESYDFSGKTIVPFATSGSSGMGDTVKYLGVSVDTSATIAEGKMLNGRQTKERLAEWANGLNV